MDRALLALCGLLTNAVIGGPGRWYRVFGIGKIARIPDKILRELERKLNREQRNPAQREMRGQMLTVSVIVFALIMGFVFGAMFNNIEAVLLVILTLSLPVRPIYDRISGLRKQLQAGNIPGARHMLDSNLWRHMALLDEHGLARAGIETLTIGFSEKILSPIFWYLCCGLPGLFITLSVNVMQEVLPKPADPSFGKASEWAHGIWHFLPSRFAALLWLVACLFLPARDILTALKGIGRGLATASPQMLSLISASSVLKLSLGGPTSAYGNHSWVDAGPAKTTANDVRRALFLFALLNLFLFVLLGLCV